MLAVSCRDRSHWTLVFLRQPPPTASSWQRGESLSSCSVGWTCPIVCRREPWKAANSPSEQVLAMLWVTVGSSATQSGVCT